MIVEFLGRLSDHFGASQTLDCAGMSIAELRADLGDPLDAKTIRAVANDVVVPEDYVIKSGDRIAFLPPVGGG